MPVLQGSCSSAPVHEQCARDQHSCSASCANPPTSFYFGDRVTVHVDFLGHSPRTLCIARKQIEVENQHREGTGTRWAPVLLFLHSATWRLYTCICYRFGLVTPASRLCFGLTLCAYTDLHRRLVLVDTERCRLIHAYYFTSCVIVKSVYDEQHEQHGKHIGN